MRSKITLLATGVRDSSGDPLALGTVTSYQGGTTTLEPLYQDIACTIPHQNPLTLDSAGKKEAYSVRRVKLVIASAAGSHVQTADHEGHDDTDVATAAATISAGPGLTNTEDGELAALPDGLTTEINEDGQIAIKTDTAFNEISPATTKGDLIAETTTGAARLAVGSNDQVLAADSSQSTGLKWASVSTLSSGQGSEIGNLGIACSVNGGALTIALKTKALADPSTSSPVNIGFRNATSATGDYVNRAITAALSLVISSGSTLGLASGSLSEYVYIYAIDNGGTVVLGAVGGGPVFDEGSVASTTAEGGAGGADTRYTMYSTAAQTNKAVRLIARLKFTLTTAGTWDEVPEEIALWPFSQGRAERHEVLLDNPSGHGSTNGAIKHLQNVTTVGTYLTGAASATLGGKITVNKEGLYAAFYTDGRAGAAGVWGISRNSSQLGTSIASITAANRLAIASLPAACITTAVAAFRAVPGDELRPHTDGAADAATANFRVIYLGP